MKIALIAAIAKTVLVAAVPATAASSSPTQAQQPQPRSDCVSAKNTAQYVPGVDAKGRPVAPADLPGSNTDTDISTEIYAEVPSKNRKTPPAGVLLNLPGLEARPLCPPSPPEAPERPVRR